ncbi:hypothetical protein SEUCBS139899_009905 [Sporothrix eucalyptigena]
MPVAALSAPRAATARHHGTPALSPPTGAAKRARPPTADSSSLASSPLPCLRKNVIVVSDRPQRSAGLDQARPYVCRSAGCAHHADRPQHRACPSRDPDQGRQHTHPHRASPPGGSLRWPRGALLLRYRLGL